MRQGPMAKASITQEMTAARRELHALVETATAGDLRRPSDGTRWSNGELLFHMVFGYMIVRTLLPLVHLMGRLPSGVSRAFSGVLGATTPAFHVVNYLGARGGALVFRGERLSRRMDLTVDALLRRLEHETEASLERSMHFPVGWDPYFRDVMTVGAVYHYATQHFEHHRRQLSL